MKTLSSFLLIALVSITSIASAQWTQGTIPTTNNRVIFYEQFKTRSKGPVLVFLPGINRGLLSSDPLAKKLAKEKVPFVMMHFAEQVDSVIQTAAQKTNPDYSKIDVKDLADEVKTLVTELGIEKPVPVTLSYSAVVTSSLDSELFPIVIETAPISKQTDTLPAGVVAFYEAWEQWVKAFPYGSEWLKNTKRVQLFNHWSVALQGQKARLPELQNPTLMTRAVHGYTALTLAADGFDLREQNFKKGPARYFILGENEEVHRSELQWEAIRKYQTQTGDDENVFVIKGAGHIVPTDKPADYAEVLQTILKELK